MLPEPDAAITYSSDEFCTSSAAEAPVQADPSLTGTFVEPTGNLTFNPTNGNVTFSSSSPGGPYIIYFNAVDAQGCTAEGRDTITLAGLSPAAVSFARDEYCSNEGTLVPQYNNGVLSGTFENGSPGVGTLDIIDPTTGEIDLASSTPGTYVVHYIQQVGSSCIDTILVNGPNGNITIHEYVEPDFTFPDSVCEGSGLAAITSTATGGPGTFSYEVWSGATLLNNPAFFNGNSIDTDVLPPLSTYRLVMRTTNGTCTDSLAQPFTVIDRPDATFSYLEPEL